MGTQAIVPLERELFHLQRLPHSYGLWEQRAPVQLSRQKSRSEMEWNMLEGLFGKECKGDEGGYGSVREQKKV